MHLLMQVKLNTFASRAHTPQKEKKKPTLFSDQQPKSHKGLIQLQAAA